jgi:hypothetical protein
VPTQQEIYLDVKFAIAGLETSFVFDRQPGRNTRYGPAQTTAEAVNVRAFEARTDRCRGGSRPGLSRYIDAKVGD